MTDEPMPAFTVLAADGREMNVYAEGRIEGFPPDFTIIVNRIPLLTDAAYARGAKDEAYHTVPNDEFARIDGDVVTFDWTEILRRAATDEPFAGAAKVILAAFRAGWETADPFDWRPEQVERMKQISATRDWRPNRIERTASDTDGSQARAETGFE